MKKPMKNPAAVALGRLGGRAKSAAKAKAARDNAKLGGLIKSPAKAKAAALNGKKGGWPKSRKRGPKGGRLPSHQTTAPPPPE